MHVTRYNSTNVYNWCNKQQTWISGLRHKSQFSTFLERAGSYSDWIDLKQIVFCRLSSLHPAAAVWLWLKCPVDCSPHICVMHVI